MFGKARWRLALWFAGVVVVILMVIGGAVLLTARRAMFDGVNDDLHARADPFIERGSGGVALLRDVQLAPAFTAGGYFYAVVRENGTLLRGSDNADPEGLPSVEQVADAFASGPAYADTKSSEGEDLRIFMAPVHGPANRPVMLEVGRSTEPERQALQRLVLILLGGGGAGAVLAVAGGFFLAGRTLRPIQTAMEKQRVFVADASHELRTPLALIRANAEILKREARKPVRANLTSVDDIIEETDRLSSLVGQMLTLARSDSGEAALETAPVDIAVVAAEVAREMRLLAEPKKITLETHASSSVVVRGDATRLRELLTVLLDNAIKYSDDGASVRLDVRRDDGKALVAVSDNGRGIPAAALPRIFDRFYRVDKARSREMGGTGLGLAIAKWIVDCHKGTIGIDSAPGKGTTVRVELPAMD